MTVIVEEEIETILSTIKHWAEVDGKKCAVQMQDGETLQSYTYEELKREVILAAKCFSEFGLQAESRVILLGPNSPKWVLSILSIFECQATAVLLDPRMESEDLNRLIKHSDAQLILTTEELAEQLDHDLLDLVPTLDLERDFASLQKDEKICPKAPHDGDSTISCLLYTSGTTGDYKGVLIGHESINMVVEEGKRRAYLTHEDQMLAILPATHIYGLIMTIFAPLSEGGTVTFVKAIRGDLIMSALNKTGTTIMLCVPRILELFYAKIMNEIRKKSSFAKGIIFGLMRVCCGLRKLTGLNLGKKVFGKIHSAFGGSLSRFVSGAASLDPKIHRDLEAIGFTIMEGYGLTETTALISCNPVDHRVIGSVGRIIQGVEVKLDGEDDRGIGEICIKGSNVMRRYFRDPAATEEVMKDGWFHTGDLGRFDQEGYLHITGRIKELIITSNGENVAPIDIENKYRGLPQVEDLAVVGIQKSSDHFGEEVHAAVIVSPNAKEPEVAMQTIRDEIMRRSDNLSSELRIRHVHFVDEIPKTTTLKVKRKILRDMLKEKRNEESTSA